MPDAEIIKAKSAWWTFVQALMSEQVLLRAGRICNQTFGRKLDIARGSWLFDWVGMKISFQVFQLNFSRNRLAAVIALFWHRHFHVLNLSTISIKTKTAIKFIRIWQQRCWNFRRFRWNQWPRWFQQHLDNVNKQPNGDDQYFIIKVRYAVVVNEQDSIPSLCLSKLSENV